MNNLNPESKLYFYKLVADSGGAPCVTEELLSLAICKPMIRSTAKAGDVIFGFAANALHKDNRLIYIAVIKDNLGTGRYFREHVYMNRDDCIYRWQDREFVIRSDARFHETGANLEHDLGAPPDYARANVLLSDDFRYFGGSGAFNYKDEFLEIKAAVE